MRVVTHNGGSQPGTGNRNLFKLRRSGKFEVSHTEKRDIAPNAPAIIHLMAEDRGTVTTDPRRVAARSNSPSA